MGWFNQIQNSLNQFIQQPRDKYQLALLLFLPSCSPKRVSYCFFPRPTFDNMCLNQQLDFGIDFFKDASSVSEVKRGEPDPFFSGPRVHERAVLVIFYYIGNTTVAVYLQPGPTAPEGGRKVVISGCSPKSFDLALKPPSSDITLQGPTQFYCGGHRGKSFSTKGWAQNFGPMEESGPIKLKGNHFRLLAQRP